MVAHANSLRGIIKHLLQLNEKEIIDYHVPTACPLVFEFDEHIKVKRNFYLVE